MEWQPIESAPRDGTSVLVAYTKDDVRNPHWGGRMFVARHEGYTASGPDLGWALFPGYGGVPDCWLDCWMPLPPPPHP